MNESMRAFNSRLIDFTASRQYESSVLPGKQLGLQLPLSPFSQRQQQQSRYDGLTERDDVTQRPLVEVVEPEAPAHILRERRKAAIARREPLNSYSQLPLTGCPLSTLPSYQLPQYFGHDRPVSEEGEILETAACHHRLDRVPWIFNEDGSLDQFATPDGRQAGEKDFQDDAERWEGPFAHDYRWLSGHNHDHTCHTTCLKNMKKTSAMDAQKATKPSKAPPCRFWFFHVVTLKAWDGMRDVVKRVRRRGKAIVEAPFVASTNEHNEYGLVEPERPQPFRSPSSDIIGAGDRCNVDFRIMARGFPEDDDVLLRCQCDDKQLARCFVDITVKDLAEPLVRRMALSVIALHVAAHNCDFYITKYQSKALPQLQNLVSQYAMGIKRLEDQEDIAKMDGEPEMTPKDRARKITLRLQSSANRCSWFSSTELAVYVETGDTVWLTHRDVPLFFSRIIFMVNACRRVLENRSPGLIEPAHVPIEAIEIRRAPSDGTAVRAMDTLREKPSLPVDAALLDGRGASRLDKADEAASAAESGTEDGSDDGDDGEGDLDAGDDGDDDEPADGDAVELTSLHATTYRVDDWLHRGPFLAPMPLHLYLRFVTREKKPRLYQSSQSRSSFFQFDDHYPYSERYVQRLKRGNVVARLVGPQCPQYEEEHGEGFSLWHLALFAPARCPGPDCCRDPVMFKEFFQRRSADSPHFICAPVWRTHLAKLKALSARAEAKTREAQRIPVLFDTTLVKQWFEKKRVGPAPQPGAMRPQADTHLRLIIMAMLLKRTKSWPAEVFLCICRCAGVEPGFHEHQLHLEEFAALHCKDVIGNVSCQLLVDRKPLRSADAKIDEDSDTDEAPLPPDHESWKEQEVLGGDADDIDIEEDDFCGIAISRPIVNFQIEELQGMTARVDEIARANQPGRHKEPDVHAKEYPKAFHDACTTPPVAANRSTTFIENAFRQIQSATEFNNDAGQSYQMATAKLRRANGEMQGDQVGETGDMNASTWQNMQNRNADREKPRCETVPLEGMMAYGPAHVAWQLIKKCDTPFNDEQIDALALMVGPLERVWQDKVNGAQAQEGSHEHLPGAKTFAGDHLEAIRQKYLLPNDLGLPRVLLIGGGGCGKTTMLLKVISPLLETFFACVARATPSNKAARNFKAKTIHSLSGLRPVDSLRTANLRIRSDAIRKKMDAVQVRAGALLIDEALQVQGQLWHACCLLFTIARERQYNLKLSDYAMQRQIAGRVSFLCLSGDHLQLPPVPKRTSLVAPLDNANDEQKAGAAMFSNIEHVFIMKTMMRFRDPVLRSILEKMRTPGGEKLTPSEWQALQATHVDADLLDGEASAALLRRTKGWYHSCYLWVITSLASFACAKLSAKDAGQVLLYYQAVDNPRVPPPYPKYESEGGAITKEIKSLYADMLKVPNLNTTKRLPGIVCFHLNMRIRLTCSVLPPWAVQDSSGTIINIDLHAADRQSLAQVRDRSTLEHKLQYPPTLYVKLDDVDIEFLPPSVCDSHAVVGFDASCCDCKNYPGVIQVVVQQNTWYFQDDRRKYSSPVVRQQLPIVPEKACNLYGLQGSTTDPGLVAYLTMPKRLDHDVRWLIIYVMLSRVRGLDCLVTFGLSEKIRAVIERGPPENLVRNFDALFKEKSIHTLELARKFRAELGWPTA